MSTTLRDFYAWLSDHFQQEGRPTDTDGVRAELEQNGFGDVTAYDVREAVNLMYDEGDVFAADQSSVLDAYTGGNTVDQSFNASDFGNVNASGTANTATTGSAGGGGGSGGGSAPPVAQQEPVKSTSPQPPPMDPKEGYTDLDAAVEQIVYVTNITNNTTNNTTTINDNDVFEDNDTIVDNSVDQNILANGDVNQDFDNITQGDGGIANTGVVADANLVTGDNDVVIADDISDATIVDGDNSGIVADEINGPATVGDGNETNILNNSDNNAIGDGATAIEGDGNAFGDGAIGLNDSDGNVIGDGSSALNVAGDNSGVIAEGGGDVEAITDSNVGQAGFGDGDQTVVVIDDSTVTDSAVQTGDGNSASLVEDNDNILTIDTDTTITTDIVENNTAVVEETLVIAGGDADLTDSDTVTVAGDDGDGDALVEGT